VYKQPLGHLQSVRHRVAEMAAEVEIGRRFVHSVAESYRDGKIEAKEICMIKFQIIDIVQRVVDRCHQLHGAAGFMEDSWIGRAHRDARVLSLGGGSSEVMKDLVAGYLRL
jgi:alkylation response protein AidB-like acyl-CoA dehydrogenase